MAKKKLMIHDFKRMKEQGEKIAWLTAYDYPTAQFAEAAGLGKTVFEIAPNLPGAAAYRKIAEEIANG